LIVSHTTGSFPNGGYAPTVWDSYSSVVSVGGTSVNLSLFDTAGEEEYDRLRPRSYPDTHIFIVCYSIDNPESYSNVSQKWLPEIVVFDSLMITSTINKIVGTEIAPPTLLFQNRFSRKNKRMLDSSDISKD